MVFTADLHIHSRFSRATSKRLNARSLAAWAMLKGINVLGTGDFTHPAWRAELQELLILDEASGLYRLREPADLADALPQVRLEAPEPLFLLQTEISSIYKRHGKVRKVHNLVFMPDMDSAERFSRRLASIGNLASDGRPILGLDAHDLLEIVLETTEKGVLIPAHAWTPWFAIFGSKSGFDSLEECFGDLTPHIFALETGLSSDPAMNRLWSHLDHLTLISNSDAHSGENLGREVNYLEGTPGYDNIFAAMRANARRETPPAACSWAGTAEFFPEEGKYHLDGHRACHVVMDPRKERIEGDVCPVCGKPMTVGVLHRVLALADRKTPLSPAASGEPESLSLIPLPELLGEICGAGVKTQKVTERYRCVLEDIGPEMFILRQAAIADLSHYWEPLGEAVARMRAGRVIRQGGYDGEYGVVRVFTPQEAADFAYGKSKQVLLPFAVAPRMPQADSCLLAQTSPTQPVIQKQKSLCSPPQSVSVTSPAMPTLQPFLPKQKPAPRTTPQTLTLAGITYSPEQHRALTAGPAPVLILAGPGSGKTRVLVGRIQHLLAQGNPAESLLAVTFTCRAAQEMQERLQAATLPWCDTLHALALRALRQMTGNTPLLLDEQAAFTLFTHVDAQTAACDLTTTSQETMTSKTRLHRHWEELQLAREQLRNPLPEVAESARRYAERKQALGVMDYTDLLEQWLALTEANPATALHWQHVLVDEIQDLSPLQLRLVRALLPPDGIGFFGIGDPDQSIYAFRGAQSDIGGQLARQWPSLHTLQLHVSHRAVPLVLTCATAALGGSAQCGSLTSLRGGTGVACAFHAPTAFEEAQWIARHISGLLGSTSHTLLDEDRYAASQALEQAHGKQPIRQDAALAAMQGTLAPGEIAVLVRLRAQIPLLGWTLDEHGIPWISTSENPYWQDTRVARIVQEAARALGLDTELAKLVSHGMPLLSPLDPLPPVDWQRGPAALLEACPYAFDTFFTASPAWAKVQKLWKQASENWEGLLALLRQSQEDDLLRGTAQQVRLLTLHAAKGLEFRAVFLPALEDGLLPFRRAALSDKDAASEDNEANEQAQEAEERRLFYVGITRASDAVFFSWATTRRLYHRELHFPLSPLLQDVLPLCRRTTLHAHTRVQARQGSLL